ncbi:LysR family transcriptional regulator [Lactobacillus sp. ESL0791]|uniref:LysR family transcriptional regulator n=1 Tax=Lactobacillus sp. ESL0791 TaxID=2983234 RepID=UPI0023F8A8F0|nr:LysR family transcriptional regulator [Lactobacillus sp. ESL0791]MDF7637969.1 LysR family transcriptional regulator [Lactobacillus sp. ESL0791]
MSINQIYYVIKLSETRNFTKAANELFIAQPTLSQQIKKLEDELNVKLFIRTKSEVTITEAGKSFVYYAKKILNNIDELKISLNKFRLPKSKSIKVGLLWPFGYTKVLDYIKLFQKTYPNIEIKVLIDGSVSLMTKLQNHKIDLAFIVEPPKYQRNLNLLSVDTSRIVCVMNNNHPLATSEKIFPKDLDGQKILMISHNSNVYLPLYTLLVKNNVKPIIIGESSEADVVIQIAQSNMAISFLSEEVFKKIRPENVVAIPLFPKIYRNIYLASVANFPQTNVIKTFINFIKNEEKTR